MQTLYSSRKTATIFFTSCLIVFSNIASAENEEDRSLLEVISITASKTAKTINQTPDSISVVLAEEIAQLAPQHINQVLDSIPGVWISRGNGQEHLTAIRSPVLTGAGSCGSFFMGLDGISIRAPGFCNANQLFDINYEQSERIDVLRSPASTLYGGNALHGVINVLSPNAFDESINMLGLQLGSYDYTRLSNSYSRVSKDSAWLNLVNVTQENGFQSQSGYDQQKMTHIYQTRGSLWDTKTVVDLSVMPTNR
jgi:iron complex outermembrane receptor protein